MTFIQFMKIKQDRGDSTGQFARLILSVVEDMFPPVRSSQYSKWSVWLQNSGGTKSTVTAFDTAWEVYNKHYRNIVSIDSYRHYKATRTPSQEKHDMLHRIA